MPQALHPAAASMRSSTPPQTATAQSLWRQGVLANRCTAALALVALLGATSDEIDGRQLWELCSCIALLSVLFVFESCTS